MARKGSRRSSGMGIVWVAAALGLALLAAITWAALWPARSVPGEEVFPEEGRDHVNPPATLAYKTDPPTSGPHYPNWAPPGFYTDPQPAPLLVHSLEHGNIVIYYDPERTPASVKDRLRQLADQTNRASRSGGMWDGIVVVPRPDPQHQVILTAWRRMLRLTEWNEQQAQAFIDAHRGRGPENPVR